MGVGHGTWTWLLSQDQDQCCLHQRGYDQGPNKATVWYHPPSTHQNPWQDFKNLSLETGTELGTKLAPQGTKFKEALTLRCRTCKWTILKADASLNFTPWTPHFSPSHPSFM